MRVLFSIYFFQRYSYRFIRHILLVSYLTSPISYLFFSSCTTPKRASNQNLSGMYRKDASQLHPRVIVYHTDDEKSLLHFRISSKELLYTRQNSSMEFTAGVQLHYKLTASYESRDILDSATVKITDANYNSSKELYGKIPFRCKSGANFLMEILVTDMNRAQSVKLFLTIEKSNLYGRQNFMVIEESTSLPLFRNYIRKNESVRIRHKESGRVIVRYYNRDFPLAPPPFSTFTSKPFVFKPDSFFVLQGNDSNQIVFKPEREGFYHFQTDSSRKEGLTLFCYPDDFPQITTPGDMLGPLRYITSRHEYEDMANAPNKKQAVEKFWLSVSGSKERGKDLIRKFYGRVRDANTYFSSYLEGWKTDRGMIYIVYGAPNAIYRTSNTETWVYGDGSNNLLTVTLTFDKLENPFTDNDYKLYRSTIYQNSWVKAVDLWRQGRVYLDY